MTRLTKGFAVCICAGFSLTHTAFAETLLSPDGFRDALIENIESRGEGELCLARLENAGLKLGLNAGQCDYHAYTENAYVDYLGAPSRLGTILDDEADRLFSIMNTENDMSGFTDRLVVQLRPKDFVSDANKGADSVLAARRFAGDMYAVLMLDSPETLSVVYEDLLRTEGLSEDDAFALAAENTRLRMGDVISDDYGEVTRMYSQNGLISGQVWLPETCETSSADAVYFLYDYNGVLKVDESDMMGISKLLGYARHMIGEGSSLSETVVSCTSGEWRQLWPATHASLDGALAFPG